MITPTVISYLVLLRLQEMGFGALREIVLKLNSRKMGQLLGYFWNPVCLERELKARWNTILDHEYVMGHLVKPLQATMAQGQALVDALEYKVEHGYRPKKSNRAPTGA
jgi:hypothetical protein